jgi:hypothetical protein
MKITLVATMSVILSAWTSQAAQIGIKCNRGISEYPKLVLSDLQRFQRDRISTVMLCLPWNQLEPEEGRLADGLAEKKLGPVLEFCAANRITVILSNHCSYWGDKGNWSIPGWVKTKPGFESSTSCLMDPAIRALHISFLNRLVSATKDFPAVNGYNILNEPVAATKWYLDEAEDAFMGRWDGVVDICQQVRQHMTESGAKQFLIIGNHGTDPGLEAYAWKSTGKHDLTKLWTKTLDKIAAQGSTTLIEASKWHADRPKIRTENYLSFAFAKTTNDTEDFGKLSSKSKTGFQETADHAAVYYHYDGAYDYEGLTSAAVPKLEAIYPWRIGTANGSATELTFLDHRHGDRPTPYYWALRDLAAGVDSFETLDAASLPKKGSENEAFDPLVAKPGISKRWEGTGTITASRQDLPPGVESNLAARIILQPGQSIMRKVIAAHWKDCGVTGKDSFVFQTKPVTPGSLTLVVKTLSGTRMAPVAVTPGQWNACRVALQTLQIRDADIPKIQSVGFVNQSRTMQALVLDEFLLRP